MNKTMRRCVILLCFFSFLTAPALADETVLVSSDIDGAEAALTISTNPLQTMTQTELRLNMNKAHGDMLLLTSAVCDLTMPAMPMPENRPVLECGAIGCNGTVTFTMAGAWDVTCDLTFSSGKTSQFLFVIDMVQMK